MIGKAGVYADRAGPLAGDQPMCNGPRERPVVSCGAAPPQVAAPISSVGSHVEMIGM
jgi:hypothetical protein